MNSLFSPYKIGGLEIPNRFVRSATNDRTATREGRPTERTEILFGELAKGDIGLIITGHAYVHDSGIAGFDQWGIHRDDYVEPYRRVTDAVHSNGGLVVMQIALDMNVQIARDGMVAECTTGAARPWTTAPSVVTRPDIMVAGCITDLLADQL